jgi:phage baseplate assembly protein V
MSAEVAELQRRLANLFRIGKVAEIDRTQGRVKVQFGDVKTPWLPWQTSRAGSVKSWSPPAIGEQVCVVSPMGELGAGFVMGGAINYTDRPAPDNRENVERIDLPSGGAYEINVGGTKILADNGKVQLIVGGTTMQLSGGKITLNGDIEVTGDVKAGSISLKTHVHGGVMPGGSTTSTPV